MHRPLVIGALSGLLAALALDCGGGPCIAGREGCACTIEGRCDEGLDCDGSTCVAVDGTSASAADTSGGPTSTSATTTSTTTATTTTSVEESSESGPVVPCGTADARVVTFNVQSVGGEGTAQWNALGAILARLDPDVVCIQEIEDFETASFRALADSLGWGEPIQADPSPAIGGELRNGCLGPRTMNRIDSYTTSDFVPGANDLSRDVLAVRVDLDDGCHVNVLAIHAKSGQEDIDRFRRQIDFERVVQSVADVRMRYPDEPVVLVGDFNENPDDPMIGQVFQAPPAGLPESYALGDDIVFPLTYDPLGTVADAGLVRLDPTAEDSTREATWGVSGGFDGVRLDYIWTLAVEPTGALVYDACLDDGVDAPPAGAWLPLAGEPPPCSTSAAASDHFPVAADLHVP